MKICLINPPFKSSALDSSLYDPYKQPVQSPGLAYIAAVLEQNGYHADVIECPALSLSTKDLYQVIEKEKYNIIGISVLFSNLIDVIRIANKLKMMNPDCFIFLGGIYATLYTEDLFASIHGLDCCVLGEGEYACLELIDSITHEKDFRDLQNIAYFNGKEVVKNATRPFIQDLDKLPFPKITFISQNRTAGIVSSRGCYGRCSFCIGPVYNHLFSGPIVRRRSPQNIVAELEYLVKNYNVNHFIFFDDNFLLSNQIEKKRLDTFCLLLKQKKLNIKFQITARSNDIINNKEGIIKLKEVGLEIIFIGVESFVQRQLDFYNKGISVEENVEALSFLYKVEIAYFIGLIIIEPFTSIDELLTNLKYVRNLKYHEVKYAGILPVSVIDPLRLIYGSPVYKRIQESNLIDNSWLQYRFADEKVAVFYQTIQEWHKYFLPVTKLYDQIYRAHLYGMHDLGELLMEKKIKLMELDLNFLEDLCLQIRDYNFKLDQALAFISEKLDLLEDIKKHFLEAKESMDQYASEKNII